MSAFVGTGVFPLPALSLSQHRPSRSRSRRVRQRARRAAVAAGLANGAISALNSLSDCLSPSSFTEPRTSLRVSPVSDSSSSLPHARNPSSVGPVAARARRQNRLSPLSLGTDHVHGRPFPARTLRTVGQVKACADRFVSRLAPSFQSASNSDDDLVSPHPLFSSSLASSPFQGDLADVFPLSSPAVANYATDLPSLPLCSERVSLPSEAGTANLLDILPPALAERYSRPSAELFAPPAANNDNDNDNDNDDDTDLITADPADMVALLKDRLREAGRQPAAFLVRSQEDYAALVRRLLEADMVSFTKTPKVINGVFATHKSGDKQRFIVDCRPANVVFTDCSKVELPGPDLLARLSCDPSAVFLAAKSDRDNYYHRIRTPRWMWEYFALPGVRAGDVGMGHTYGPDTLIYPCCTTLPMGFVLSARFAQEAHTHLISTRCTTLQDSARLSKANDTRIDRMRYFVYIDDMNWLGMDSEEIKRSMAEYDRVMTEAGLPSKPSKNVSPSSDGVECIGVELHGKFRTVGVSPTKLFKLVRSTNTLLARPTCTGKELSRLMGHWTWACLPRRCTFAIFNAVYRFIETAGKRSFDIWPTVRRELQTAVRLVPLLFTQLDAHWFPRMIATDASSEGQGVVIASASPQDQLAMAHTPVPCCLPAADEEEQTRQRELHPLLVDRRWATIVSSRWIWEEHINVLELRALDTAVRWAISSPHAIRARLLLWADSTVTVFAVRKGRSSRYRILRRLRRLAASLLATGMQLYCNWIATEHNPADRPSRVFEFDSTLGYPGEGPRRRQHRHFRQPVAERGLLVRPHFLIDAAYAESTAKRYRGAAHRFLQWLLDAGEDPSTSNDMDQLLCEYFHDIYITNEGRNRSLAEKTLSAMGMYFPEFRGSLHSASLALRGWRRLKPSIPHPPITWSLTVVLAMLMVHDGREAYGLGTLLAFDCYLRVGELAGLTLGDFIDATDSADARVDPEYKKMALRLGKTKTGPNQFVEVRDPDVQALLKRFVSRRFREERGLSRTRRRKRPLFGFKTSSFRRVFKQTCALLDLPANYVPHSLRHGGATRDHLQGKALEDILARGRWASTKSARHYIQAGPALLLNTQVPAVLANAGRIIAADLQTSFTLMQCH